MNFDLSDEQRLLQESVARFVGDNYDLDRRNALCKAEPGFNQDYWRQFAELGWLALPFSEDDGGFGGNAVDTMLLMEEFGRGLVLEPYLASVVLGGGIVRRAADTTQRQALLPGVLDGSRILALAYAEQQARDDLHDVATTARKVDTGWTINGSKSLVWNAQSAHQLIVPARTAGGQLDRDGISLFIVDAKATGIDAKHYPTVDGLRASEVTFKDVQVDAQALLGQLHKGYDVLAATINDGILAVSAEAVGAMDVLVKDTVSYTQQREQFDHPLSDFQVVQHRLVDMLVEYELCKSLLYRATMETAQQTPGATQSVHALKHMVGTAGTFVSENAVQLHGGMGMTEELRVGHYFKRLTVINLMFGDADFHLARFTDE